ncbi:MAG: radical SAM protein [Nanoarchaeota archaeon]|nr:radical SAM protein [Nanoarchaeota archaeon]
MVWSKLEFEDLEFRSVDDEVKVIFYDLFFFRVSIKELASISEYKIHDRSIEFAISEKAANNKFNRLLEKGFSSLIGPNGKKTIYIHRNSGIPLIGTNVFGIIDRDTDVLEIKPMTGCNLNCIFCSVDEGIKSKKEHDFLVEEEYIVQEFKKIASQKKGPVEAHIAGQNEPLLYPRLKQLIEDINNTGLTKDISIDTNGVLLSKEMIDELVQAGLTRINLSLNAWNQDMASKMAGSAIDIEHIKKMAIYAKNKIDLLLAPIYVQGINDQEMPNLIRFSKKVGCVIGIQNFLEYEKGRKPAKQIAMDQFYAKLDDWSKEFSTDLRLKDYFSIQTDKALEKPFHKGDQVKAVVVCPGKYREEMICASNERNITLKTSKTQRIGETVRVKLVREKHNIFKGVILKK